MRHKKDSLIITFGIINIAIMTTLVLIISAVAIQHFLDVQEMKKVIGNLAASKEVSHEKPIYRFYKTKTQYTGKFRQALVKAFNAGYYAAIMDKHNISVFRKFFKSTRTPLINAYFEGI